MEKLNDRPLERMEFNSLDVEKKLLDRASRFKVPAGLSPEEALAVLKTKIANRGKSPMKIKTGETKLLYWIGSIAAGMLILLGIWQLFIRPHEAEFIAEKGVHKEYQLPDGSKVSMNADSRISWSDKTFINERNVSFTGEAFFDIAKGTPFTVETDNGSVKILGTSFNVYARGDSFKVSCFTGKVLVSSGGKSVEISPGESAELSGNMLKNYAENYPEKIKGWINGEFYFENSSLAEVFDEIERQFNVKLASQVIKQGFFTGSFTTKDLRSALDIVCIPMDLNYEIGSNGKISITEIIK